MSDTDRFMTLADVAGWLMDAVDSIMNAPHIRVLLLDPPGHIDIALFVRAIAPEYPNDPAWLHARNIEDRTEYRAFLAGMLENWDAIEAGTAEGHTRFPSVDVEPVRVVSVEDRREHVRAAVWQHLEAAGLSLRVGRPDHRDREFVDALADAAVAALLDE